MPESNHWRGTPGPWEARNRTAFADDEIAIETMRTGSPHPNGGKVIALCYGPDREANAASAAAVPQMIDALLAGVAYDTLLLRFKGPQPVLYEGDSAEIDAAYDRWRDLTVAALTAAGVKL